MQNHFDKYCFAGKKQVRFRLGIGSDDGVGQMKSYKQQQDSRIIKENTLHIVYKLTGRKSGTPLLFKNLSSRYVVAFFQSVF
jgi:hypothetical protein